MEQQQEVTSYFSSNPGKYAAQYGEETAEGYSFRMRRERLIELLGKGNGKVLDIGCGPAVMTKEIMDLGWAYTGTDISEKMIEQAKELFPYVAFSVGSVEKIQAPDKAFDAVVAMGLVEYVNDDVAAIKEMKRVVKPGGRLLISLPNWWSPPRMWDRYIVAPAARIIHGRKKDFIHKEYLPHSYTQLLAKEGFGINAIVSYNFRLLPRPLDYWFPKLAVMTARILEPLRHLPLLKYWATGVIVEATRLQ